ncbi:MAG: hypothetical protein MJ157_00220, partial [Clostridia bacterium]|nr:hypothetical protein [Clostridia bacterium]
MLKKLLKYDFRAFSHNLFPLQLGVLASSLLAVIFARLTMVMTDSSFVVQTFGIFSGLITGLLFTVICGSSLATLILICIRMQKNFFGDEGYLTFSLPLTPAKLIWSKVITGTAWIFINGIAVALSLFIIGVFGTTRVSLVNSSFLELLNIFRYIGDVVKFLFCYDEISGLWFMAILGVINFLLYILMEVLTIYFAVIAGGIAVKQYKLLVSTGIYLGAQFCLKFILFAVFALAMTFLESAEISLSLWVLLLGGILIQGGISCGQRQRLMIARAV